MTSSTLIHKPKVPNTIEELIHDRGCDPALAPEGRLNHAQHRPRRHDDHRRPDGRRQEWPQDPQRRNDEPAEDEDREHRAGEVAAVLPVFDWVHCRGRRSPE